MANEVPRIKERIAKAIAERRSYVTIGFIPSEETVQLLENAGYIVTKYKSDGSTKIYWKKQVDAIREDATRLAEVAKEANITVVKPE